MSKSGGRTWDLVAADDPTDWKDEFGFLRSLDAGLRCDLCFDIFTAPVSIKDCGHTFCSACVRNAINKPGEEMGGRCPKCMNKNVYDSSLLPQPTLENAALQWRNARSQLFTMQQTRLQEQTLRKIPFTNGHSTGKRSREEMASSSSSSTPSPSSPQLRRSKRSTSARNGEAKSYAEHINLDESSHDEFEEIQESDIEVEPSMQQPQQTDTSVAKDYRQIGASDMVQCPMCQHTFTYRALNIHLDKGTCSINDPEPSPKERGITASNNQGNSSATSTSTWLKSSGGSNGLVSPRTTDPISNTTQGFKHFKEDRRKKLVRPTYDILKISDIKKLLRDWQLNSSGNDRKRMVDRHRKWINLFNANLDASEHMRKSNAILRKELEQWERAQDEIGSGISEKRAKTWAMDHKMDFETLAKQARETHMRDRSKHLEKKKAEQAEAMTGSSENHNSQPIASLLSDARTNDAPVSQEGEN